MSKEGVSRPALEEGLRRALEARPEIVFAYLHGSFERGEPYRDIDVAIWVDPTHGRVADAVRYALDLSVDLQDALGAAIDIQVINVAPLAFRYHALRGRPIMVRDWEALHEVRARTWDAYFDFQPFARAYLREVLRG